SPCHALGACSKTRDGRPSSGVPRGRTGRRAGFSRFACSSPSSKNLPESQPKKSHHEDTKTRRNPLRFFASSCLRGEQDACAPRRTDKNPFLKAKDFRVSSTESI